MVTGLRVTEDLKAARIVVTTAIFIVGVPAARLIKYVLVHTSTRKF